MSESRIETNLTGGSALPLSRIEKQLYKILGNDVEVEEARSRIEKLLSDVEPGGGVLRSKVFLKI